MRDLLNINLPQFSSAFNCSQNSIQTSQVPCTPYPNINGNQFPNLIGNHGITNPNPNLAACDENTLLNSFPAWFD